MEELRKRETENGARDTFNNLGRKSTHRTAMSDATRFRPGSTVRVSRNGSISIERTPTASEDYTSLTEETTTTSSINSRSTTSYHISKKVRSVNFLLGAHPLLTFSIVICKKVLVEVG